MKKLLFIPALCALFTSCDSNSDTDHDSDLPPGCLVENPGTSSDWVITGKVQAAILADSSLSARSRFISINTTDGVVTLSGTVITQDDVSRAETIARGISGVVRVKNLLKVKP